MRTSALRLSIGAYSDETWHCTVIRDIYERGVMVDSTIDSRSLPTTEAQLRWNVGLALERIIAFEHERIERAAAG